MLAIAEKALGKEHPQTATVYHNIAMVYSRQGEYAAALEWYQKALSMCEGKLGRILLLSLSTTYFGFATVYDRLNNADETRRWRKKASAELT